MSRTDRFQGSYPGIRKTLLFICLPICVLMLFCALYSTYLTVKTWNCKLSTNISDSDHNYDKKSHDLKCKTVIDEISSKILKVIPNRKLIMCVRTTSLFNTLLTYLSACSATYSLSKFPLLWLSITSISSFLITFYVSISYGPLTGVNNFELVPVFVGLHIWPYLVVPVVLTIDFVICVLALTLVLDIYRRRK